jgi:hypothetical protein
VRDLERHRDRTAMHVARSMSARAHGAGVRHVLEVADGIGVHCPRGCPGEESHARARTQRNFLNSRSADSRRRWTRSRLQRKCRRTLPSIVTLERGLFAVFASHRAIYH